MKGTAQRNDREREREREIGHEEKRRERRRHKTVIGSTPQRNKVFESNEGL